MSRSSLDGLFDTCIDGGGMEAECSEAVRQAILDCLGDVNTLEITGWIGSPNELDTLFETGDRYGTYRVTINEAGQGVSVTPSTITLTEKTIGLLNAGNFAFGFEVVYGEDAIITIGSFTLKRRALDTAFTRGGIIGLPWRRPVSVTVELGTE